MGGSSTMPHKRNPAGSARAIACAHRVRGEASILFGAMAQEHERAAGAWQAEWQAVSGALAATGGAAAAVRGGAARAGGRPGADAGEPGPDRRAGHDRGRGHRAGRGRCWNARTPTTWSAGVARSGRPLREALLAEPRVADALSPADLDAALDPANYLGASQELIDRVLARYDEEEA